MADITLDPSQHARAHLRVGDIDAAWYRIDAVCERPQRLPFTVKVLLENVLRQHAVGGASAADVAALASWRPGSEEEGRRAAEAEEQKRLDEAHARAEAEQAALEQLKEENPEAYAKPEPEPGEGEEGAEGGDTPAEPAGDQET